MIVRVYTGDDGQSHFEEVTPSFSPDGHVERAPMEGAKGIIFTRFRAGQFIDWHPAPRRQYVIILSGLFEVRIGDGSVRRLGPGDILLADDLTGRGHTTRIIGDQPCHTAAVPLTG